MVQLNTRDSIVLACLPADSRTKLQRQMSDSSDLDTASGKLADTPTASRIKLLRQYAELSNDHEAIVKGLAANGSLSSTRDVAASMNVADLTALVTSQQARQGVRAAGGADAGGVDDDARAEAEAAARGFRQRLFVKERDAVLRKMVDDDEIAVLDEDEDDDGAEIKRHILGVLDNNQELFKKGLMSLDEDILKDVDSSARPRVTATLRNIQRVQSLATAPAAVSAMFRAGFKSAQQIASVPATNFAQDIAGAISDHDTEQGDAMRAAKNIHAVATSVALHTNIALTHTLQTMRGTGVRAIDGPLSRAQRLAVTKKVTVSGMRSIVNLEQLFGSMDFCDCSDCSSVTSPAAYFVDILNFLRNNNLKDKYEPGWEGTALEMLLRRRPDLVNIELTCANTNTVLPYIDLSNEIMESFVVNLKKFIDDDHEPKQATLDVFNVDDDDVSGTLLSQPANVNYVAYCRLKDAVYPFSLPYHQPLDEIRILLGHINTSRHELMDVFRPTPHNGDSTLDDFELLAQGRAYVAEYLSITQQDYRILTRQVFYSKEYFDYTTGRVISVPEYESRIGLQPVYKYWGYQNGDWEMFSINEDQKIGLTFVKKQFLPRSGIAYTDLVDLLRTKYINPNYPAGWALLILQRIRWSYRYLLTLVGPEGAPDRYDRLIAFLERYQPVAELFERLRQEYIDNLGKADQSIPKETLEHLAKRNGYCECPCSDRKIWRCWVLRYFDLVGDLIVLDSRDKGVFEVEGWLILYDNRPSLRLRVEDDPQPFPEDPVVGYLHRDGRITHTEIDGSETLIGHITEAGVAVDEFDVPFVEKYRLNEFLEMHIWNIEQTDDFGQIDHADSTVYLWDKERAATWGPIQDTCSIEKVRLVRLSGEALRLEDFDRMHRFLRLWRRLGWSIDDLDQALLGLSDVPETDDGDGEDPEDPDPEPKKIITWDDFDDNCGGKPGCDNGGGGQPDCCPLHDGEDWTPPSLASITPAFLKQIVALKKLLETTGLDLPNLLTFWADMSTHGQPKSLYASLFLTHNLLGVDRVFAADVNGNYLTFSPPEKLSAHSAVVMAAFQIRSADDLALLVKLSGLPADPDLTIKTVSHIYRRVLLSRVLNVKYNLLPYIVELLGDPFEGGATRTIKFLEDWDRVSMSGFSLQQLVYVVRNIEVDPLHPVGPSLVIILRTTKQLTDGVDGIEKAYPDVTDPTSVTAETITTAASQLFDSSVVGVISAVLEGKSVWQTNAPVGLTITVPETLKKLKYTDTPGDATTPPSAAVQMTGILSDEEVAAAKALAAAPKWSEAIDRLMRKPVTWLNDTLFGIFPDVEEAKAVLLAGDVLPVTPAPTEEEPVPVTDPGTAPGKRLYFLTAFLPFLRETLSNKLVADVMTSVSSLSLELTQLLLTDILKSGDISALKALRNLRPPPSSPTASWKGYLIPNSTDTFTFFSTADDEPLPILLDGAVVAFPTPLEDPTNVWQSAPIKLTAGRLYTLEVPGRPATQLQWKSSRSPRSKIPASALLPGTATDVVTEVFAKLEKAGLVVANFALTAAEITFLTDAKDDFAGFDLNALTLAAWKRLSDYKKLRDGLSAPQAPLIDLFKWAAVPEAEADGLVDKIIESTRWDSQKDALTALLKPEHFNLEALSNFKDERALLKLKTALELLKRLGGFEVDAVFSWTNPLLKFWPARGVADSIRKLIRSRYTTTDWEAAVQPLYNTLRENQKNSLIAYMLVQPVIIEQGIVDADGLFEFFLIDVQMSSCLQTSRIKQAISSVQVFIQRCLLGLELDPNKGDNVTVRVDPVRWGWMEKYRVWEANRKVFLYPENWLVPELRDDKSSFYKELESELLQKDVDADTVVQAFRNYLFKVDEVANMETQGLFLEETEDSKVVHIVSRTRCAPYMYYYRKVDAAHGIWTPWEKMTVDIPNYTNEDSNGIVIENGAYVTPVVWNGRLLVFFPQFAKKTVAPPKNKAMSMSELGNAKPSGDLANVEYWEVKMCFAERREGSWGTKVISSEAVYEKITDWDKYKLPNLNSFLMVPRVVPLSSGSGSKLSIDVVSGVTKDGGVAVGAFDFVNGRLLKSTDSASKVSVETPIFGYWNGRKTIYSLQAKTDDGAPELYDEPPYVNYSDTVTRPAVAIKFSADEVSVQFSHDFVHTLLGGISVSDKLATVFDLYGQLKDSQLPNAFGRSDEVKYHELKRPYALYNWELGLHSPLAVMDKFVQQKQFDKALDLCHAAIFNPMLNTNDVSKCWQFRPFQEIVAKDYLENFFQMMVPNQENTQVTEWRDNPFAPHVVARSRPVAYMKAVVMKYIDILVQYGDYYFRQNTLETLPLAIQMYVRASHVYGPAGQKIPKRGKTASQTYRTLLERFDAFSNAAVDLELEFPFSNQITRKFPIGFTGSVDTPVDLPNIFGSSTTRYFCIPDNPQLRALRATIDDRLFKLRHCQDINGVVQRLPLFEPPIDPGLLVRATAAGVSISSVLNDLNSPMSNYRFIYLVQKAHDVCTELKAFTAAFLAAKEKRDGESLAALRQSHEVTMNELTMEIKKRQLDEANESIKQLYASRESPVYRMRHYIKLLGEDESSIPADFTSPLKLVDVTYEQPVEDSGLKLIKSEKDEQDKSSTARNLNVGIGAVETLSSIFLALPSMNADGKPLGVGATVKWGFPQLGHGLGAIARGLKIGVDYLNAQATMSGRKAGLQRAMQDRVQMCNAAGLEIKSIDAQIVTQQVRVAIAEHEISNQQQMIDNSHEVRDFLATKYTNVELYSYLEATSRQLAYQAYTVAYDLAKRAEQTYHFERPGESSRSFISFGYWDPARDGLLAGESLGLAIRQLETAYQGRRGHDFEVTKSISLRQLAPLELVRLRETARCEFSLPEVLFDMDFAGHYMRRIRSVALSVPCVTGPHVGVSATLRLLENKFRVSAIAADAGSYPEVTGDGPDPRFANSSTPIAAIATSSGQGDPGVFEINMKDERFLPFEGAGAISRWSLTLPSPAGPTTTALRPFDYSTITDVMLQVRYTSMDGGDKLASAASGALRAFVQATEDVSTVGGGLYTILDLRAEFAAEWYRFISSPASPETDRTLTMRGIADRLPSMARGASKVTALEVRLFSSVTLPATALTLAKTGAADTIPFTDGDKVGRLFGYTASTDSLEVSGDWVLTLKAPDGADVDLIGRGEGMWIVVRYQMKL
ncbi:hypothetical protein BFJ68_g15698 [Fusarium oxysporum]|uniref:Uncharacterized protein n=1 Tax=Fusarium oxysporum TaxID=5507 RepID=A0A420NSV7_FUSOX|nr:hypothetical protein BFJ71_g14939 [Fusarium oxysporum]RKK93003.1 hypothetical protein BFJ68_g15698 [Fusarium oxysporum]